MLKNIFLVNVYGVPKFWCELETDAQVLAEAIEGTYIMIPGITAKGYSLLDAKPLEGEYE